MMIHRPLLGLALLLGLLLPSSLCSAASTIDTFEGKFFRGRGDTEYLQLLDISRRMFAPDPQYQNISMLYEPKWNGFVEGPTWDAWWIQNSYGPSYASLPFLEEPYVTFLQNAQDLWFDNMGDGVRYGASEPQFHWIAPDGCLCDAARPGWIVYRQGDGRVDIHDWAMEFTAAGILLESELLLVGHDAAAVTKYLPKLERSANFIETRRDTNNLFLAGPAGNLLAPSYAGWKKPDGSYGKAYLTGLSVTYVAALDRLIELEKLARRTTMARHFTELRDSAKRALTLLATDEGYYIRSLDPDGVKHGVFGAKENGYFEASPNHDAVAFRVADDAQSERILRKIESIPQLRPHDFVIPNFPCYDDMYEKPVGLWEFGRWVNGGHWSTCEARMIMAYYRLGRFEAARKSMHQLMKFADQFRLDNPLTEFGNNVYQPNEPINICYDSFGPPAAMVRGLFEYLYSSDQLTLIPHVPPGITELEQRFPIRFGKKQLFLATSGTGAISGVTLNGKKWKQHDDKQVALPYDSLRESNRVEIVLGQLLGKSHLNAHNNEGHPSTEIISPSAADSDGVKQLVLPAFKLREFTAKLAQAKLSDTYAAAHARLASDAIATAQKHLNLLTTGQLQPLAERSQRAADQLYVDTAKKLYDGLEKVLASYKYGTSTEQKILALWSSSQPNGNEAVRVGR